MTMSSSTPRRLRRLRAFHVLYMSSVLPVFAAVLPPQNPDIEPQARRLQQGIVREHNELRQHPARYAQHLRDLLPLFDGDLLRRPGEPALRTVEGAAAVREAIAFLEGVESVPPLVKSRGMSRGARDHVRDQGPGGGLGHEGSDGTQAADRVSRYGTWQRTIGENIAFGLYGPDDAREVVVSLLVDDGVASRGHRTNLFNPDFLVIGVACGEHAGYGTMCVMTYAGGYEEQ